jgi:tetratricopeptide (TPR) repeat protein
MVERARALFKGADEAALFDQVIKAAPEGRVYQEAMQFVIECRGQPTLNELIRNAVLECRSASSDGLTQEQLERDVNGWYLRPGVAALGELIKSYEAVFNRPILTSNFDPLLEIAIRKAGRGAMSINLPTDGNFNSLILSDNIAQVVHFHGFWSQGDTLHTPDRLRRERPLLAGNLRQLLQETTLVVVGYGGWADVFTDALLKAISEQSQAIDVLWTFFTRDPAEVAEKNSGLLTSFQRLIGQRVVAYAGVDCHKLFPKLVETLTSKRDDAAVFIPVQIVSRPTPLAMMRSSNLPSTDAWVGRESELKLLLSSEHSVVALHGLGGFGKSSLAAKYVAAREERRDLEGWYWADCKEQANTVQLHIINILSHITQGQITAASLKKATDKDILDLYFQHLSGRRFLFVFDNVDHYVDLETQKAIGMVDMLVERALNERHGSQLVFTCRPTLLYAAERFLPVPVEGLGVPETDQLFTLRGARWDAGRKDGQIDTVLRITQGSALHLNLIATQVAKQNIPLSVFLQRVEQGGAPEADDVILSEIWTTLREEQQNILRCLAELPHPESEQRVGVLVSSWMNFNKFGKALKALKSLNLIVVKRSGPASTVLELHPLVRTFIRRRFPKEEQAPIVDQVINFFDRMISRLRGGSEIGSLDALANWVAKTEVCLENARAGEALAALYDIHRVLLAKGFVEEFLRLGTQVIRQYEVRDDPKQLKEFDLIAERVVHVLGDLGRYQEVDQWLGFLSTTVIGKSARYIWLCNVKAYAYWTRGDFTGAKKWGSEGVHLKTSSNIDTEYDASHTLALAQRDSGEVEPALKTFLSGEKIEDVLAPNHLDVSRGGSYYGNIARCLQFLGRDDDALTCLKKSAILLERSEDSNILVNRGWAAKWIGELLQRKGAFDPAYLAFRSAASKWKVVSPGRARKAAADATQIVESLKDSSLAGCGDWECEEMYRNWLRI